MRHIQYREGYKYQLVISYEGDIPLYPSQDIKTEYIDLNKKGEILIRRGYAWDGPSGPAIDTRNFMRGSLIHDALYQLIRLDKLPREAKNIADKILLDTCVEDGMNKARAWWVYTAVKTFASRATMPSSEPPVLMAP